MTVRRSELDGRYVYQVGECSRTASKRYDFAVWGPGNENDPSGLYLGLYSSEAAARKIAATHGLQFVAFEMEA